MQQGATAPPPGDTGAGAAKPDHTKIKPASSQPADSKAATAKASDGKATGGDGKHDATAGTPTANAAGTAPASSAQSTFAGPVAAPNAAIAPTSAQPTAAPATAAAQQAQAAYQAADTATVNLPQMAFEIARQVQHGSSEFQIRLDPADLGRVNVTLAVDATGNVSAHLAVERADTLALLRQDANNLNQALAQAGLAGGKTNLQFSLSQNPFARQDNGGQPASPAPTPAGDEHAAAPVPIVPAITRYRGSFATSNLNIFV
jgi:flagellar hook-length control protein FliK